MLRRFIKIIKSYFSRPRVYQEIDYITERYNDVYEPAWNNYFLAEITFFQWMPDNDQVKDACLAVCCDHLKAADIRVDIFDKNNARLRINRAPISFNQYVRGVLIYGHRFGRFTFLPGIKAADLAEVAPITITFSAVTPSGQELPIRVLGKYQTVIEDPTKGVKIRI